MPPLCDEEERLIDLESQYGVFPPPSEKRHGNRILLLHFYYNCVDLQLWLFSSDIGFYPFLGSLHSAESSNRSLKRQYSGKN